MDIGKQYLHFTDDFWYHGSTYFFLGNYVRERRLDYVFARAISPGPLEKYCLKQMKKETPDTRVQCRMVACLCTKMQPIVTRVSSVDSGRMPSSCSDASRESGRDIGATAVLTCATSPAQNVTPKRKINRRKSAWALSSSYRPEIEIENGPCRR